MKAYIEIKEEQFAILCNNEKLTINLRPGTTELEVTLKPSVVTMYGSALAKIANAIGWNSKRARS